MDLRERPRFLQQHERKNQSMKSLKPYHYLMAAGVVIGAVLLGILPAEQLGHWLPALFEQATQGE